MPNRIEGTRAKARSHTHVLCFDDDGPDTSRNFSRGVTKEGRKAEAVAAGRAIVT